MALFNAAERRFAKAVSDLAYTNPFLPERIGREREALGPEFDEKRANWNLHASSEGRHPNVEAIFQRSDRLIERVRERLTKGEAASDGELTLYEDLVLFVLYQCNREGFDRTIDEGIALRPGRKSTVAIHDDFAASAARFLSIPGRTATAPAELTHVFALFFQIRRAFKNIFRFIVGASAPAVRLRAEIWQSIFTHDTRRYRRTLFRRMADYTTLVTGPSGTGKELVASAVGLSRYIPFDPETRSFAADSGGSFFPLNLSAMSPTLIESELFGHKRGSFTGAVADRRGWLEVCPPLGSVFIDEIGDLDLSIQVKLLRVLQTREFTPLGETALRRFEGKFIAATNRDLAGEMESGRFRKDLYYRLCSDIIETPSLRERIQDDPRELRALITHLVQRILGDEGADVAEEVEAWIEKHLDRDYAWPGNVRELEQCVRNVLIRKEYRPPEASRARATEPRDALAEAVRSASLPADELLRRYCTLVYAQEGSLERAARRLRLDRRTVKAKLDREMVKQLLGRPGGTGVASDSE